MIRKSAAGILPVDVHFCYDDVSGKCQRRLHN